MTPLDDAGRELVAAHVGLATYLADLVVPRRSPDGEDARSAALLALTESATAYTGEVPFGKFARVKIRWALRDFLRRRRPLGYRERPEGTPRIISTPEVPEPTRGVA